MINKQLQGLAQRTSFRYKKGLIDTQKYPRTNALLYTILVNNGGVNNDKD
jgi:hypothetical protein